MATATRRQYLSGIAGVTGLGFLTGCSAHNQKHVLQEGLVLNHDEDSRHTITVQVRENGELAHDMQYDLAPYNRASTTGPYQTTMTRTWSATPAEFTLWVRTDVSDEWAKIQANDEEAYRLYPVAGATSPSGSPVADFWAAPSQKTTSG